MKTAFALLLSATLAQAASVTFNWTRQEDPNVTNYNIYIGGASLTYSNTISVGNVTNYTVNNLVPDGSYFFNLTAVTIYGLESPYAGEISGVVPAPPVIVTQPQGLVLGTASTADFNVQAMGPDLHYQWRVNGSAIPKATQPRLTLPSITWHNNGMYSVLITNWAGSVTSVDAILTVVPPATANFQAASATPNSFQTAPAGIKARR